MQNPTDKPELPAPDPETERRAAALIFNARHGGTAAMSELISLIYPDLKVRACWLMRHERRGHTFGPSGYELVQRVLEKMIGAGNGMLNAVETEEALLTLLTWHMRNILVDYARAQATAKRPDPKKRQDFELSSRTLSAPLVHTETVLRVNEALLKLAKEDPGAAKAVELRFYVEFTNGEAAAAMGLSESAFRRELKRGLVFLELVLGDHGPKIE